MLYQQLNSKPALTIIYAWMSRTGRPLHITCLLLALLSISGKTIADSSTLSIASSGDVTPSGDGQFAGVFPPRINSGNKLVFISNLSNTSNGILNDSGLYSLSLAANLPLTATFLNLRKVVRENDDLVVGNTNYTIGDLSPFSSYLITNTGSFNNLALRLPVANNNSIIAIETISGDGNTSTFDLVAATGEDVPSGNGTYNSFTLAGFSAGDEVAFFSTLNSTLGGNSDNAAIFRYTTEGQEIEIARKGDPASANPFISLATIRTNDFGATVFIGTDAQDSALYLVPSNSLSFSRIVGEGDTAPTADVEPRVFSQLSEIRINNSETIGFAAVLQDESNISIANDSGLYIITSINPPVEIIREGQPTPDATANFMNFASAVTGDVPHSAFNDREQFAFTVDLQLLGGEQSSGVFRASESELIEIARKDGTYEDGIWGDFDDPVLNNKGLVAFTANLTLGTTIGMEGPINISNELLVLTDGQDYVTVAREGQSFGLKVLSGITFSNSATGGTTGLNDSAVVVYKATYADGTTSINIWRADFGWRASANDGNWDDEDNWLLGMLPIAAGDVVLDTEADVDIQGPSEQIELNSLSIGTGSGLVKLTMGTGSITTTENVFISTNGTIVGAGILTGPVDNQGIIDVTVNTVFELNGDVINDGLITLGAGSQLTLSKAYTGSGTINGPDGLTVFNGAVSPGNSPGLLLIEGNVAFGDKAVTTLELAGLNRGDGFDAIDTGGTLTLNGILDIVLLNNFFPKAGDSFLLLKADALLGEYDTVNLPEIEGLTLQLNKTQTTLSMEVQAASLSDSADSSGSSGSISWLLLSGLFILARVMRNLLKVTVVRN